MTDTPRLSTGIDGLDDLLGGGLLPGTLTAVVGSTGIGKTQFGLQFAQAGLRQEGVRGILFDMCSRGDSQNHADYARRMFGWELKPVDPERRLDLDQFFSPAPAPRRLSARVRPARPARYSGRPGFRRLAPVAGRTSGLSKLSLRVPRLACPTVFPALLGKPAVAPNS